MVGLQPEMTFPRAARSAARLWWIPLLLALVGALAAMHVASASKTTYSATGQIHDQETALGFSAGSGNPTPTSPYSKATDLDASSFIATDPAQTVARHLNAVSAAELKSHLSFSAITGTDVQLTLSGQPSRKDAEQRLNAYLAALVAWKREGDARPLQLVNANLHKPGSGASSDTIRSIETALTTIPRQIYVSQAADTSVHRGFPRWAATAGGILAGLALGLLIAAVIARFDDRIRRGREVSDPSARPVDVDSVRRPATIHNLRCELELVGMASDGATLAVTSLQRSERRTPVAAELAKAFASSGRPTVLVSADVRSGATDGGPAGVSTFLDGSDDTLEVVPLDENLVWVPAGHTSAAPEALFSTERVSRLLDQARAHGSVVVIDAPRFEDDAEGPLIPGLADVTLLVLHSGQSRWSRVDAALGRLRLVSKGPVRLCVDRASGRGYTPFGSGVARRGRRTTVPAEAQGSTG
jgi:hypothetical protein